MESNITFRLFRYRPASLQYLVFIMENSRIRIGDSISPATLSTTAPSLVCRLFFLPTSNYFRDQSKPISLLPKCSKAEFNPVVLSSIRFSTAPLQIQCHTRCHNCLFYSLVFSFSWYRPFSLLHICHLSEVGGSFSKVMSLHAFSDDKLGAAVETDSSLRIGWSTILFTFWIFECQ